MNDEVYKVKVPRFSLHLTCFNRTSSDQSVNFCLCSKHSTHTLFLMLGVRINVFRLSVFQFQHNLSPETNFMPCSRLETTVHHYAPQTS